ncbi:zinc finger protein 808-like [Aricia agestis]|uniref:zinc finger protein 808-like n=1 Tax=Aricia agestis TaxID=91739 RepID=UPI001C208E0A|nr:zinc finger protein 808-like [Aricia agestis]XP_041983737.1 zinc finger protein 808-like [Aricia agestis]
MSSNENSCDKPKEYICDYCTRTFTRYYNLQTHIENCHLNSSCCCEICYQSFGSPAGLQQHLSRGHNRFGQGLPECDICGRIYARKQNIATHMLTTHLLSYRPEIRCDLCCKVFTTERNLRRHAAMLHNPDFEYLTCDTCKRIFKGKDSLVTHIQTVHAPLKDLIKCHECDKIYTNKRNLKRHIEMSHERRVEFKCSRCTKTYTSKQSLKRHEQSVHSENHDGRSPPLCPTSTEGRDETNFSIEMEQHERSGESRHKDLGNRVACETCSATFFEEAQLRKHIKETHTFQDFYKYCKKVLLLRSGDSTTDGGNGKWHYCDMCSEYFVAAIELERHIGSRHDRAYQPSTCNVCFRRFYSRESIAEHKTVCVPPPDANPCGHCDRLFTDVSSLEFHIKIFHPRAQIADSNVSSTFVEEPAETVFKCSRCERVYYAERSLRHHVKLKHSLDEEVQCQLCGRVCSNKYYLASHMKIVHNDDDWSKCKYCGKQFKTKRNIRRHIEFTHLGRQRYRCIACDTLFKEKRSLRKHVRIKHPDSDLFPQCHICLKRFESAKSRKIHLKLLHSFNVSTFPCGVCTMSFASQAALDEHLAAEHLAENEIYKCEDCGLVLEGQATYERHRRSRHAGPAGRPGQPPRCILCDKDFSSRKTLRRHIKNFHKEFEDEELARLCSGRPAGVDCPACIRNFADDYYYDVYLKVKDVPDAVVFKCEFCKASYGRFEYLVLRHKQTFDMSRSRSYLSELCTAEMSEESGQSDDGVGLDTAPMEPESTTADVKIEFTQKPDCDIKSEPQSPKSAGDVE